MDTHFLGDLFCQNPNARSDRIIIIVVSQSIYLTLLGPRL